VEVDYSGRVTGAMISTASHIDPLAEAYHLGKQHGESAGRLLTSTPPDKRDALIESAAIRLRSYVIANVPSDAPLAEIIAHAECGFADAFSATINA
jgi:hypothetical protein